MTVTVTDRRSAFAYGDATSETGDAGAGAWNLGATHTATYAEATSCIALAINETTGTIQFDLTSTSIDLSDTLVYVQTQVVATQDPWDQGGADTPHALLLGDGTNEVAFFYSGNDRRQFSHEKDGPVGWQCFVMDGSKASAKNTAGETYVVSGTWAGFIANIGSITSVGVYFATLSKALGGGVNCYVDIIRYGNNGLRITGGGSSTEGNFSEVVAEDKSTANLKAHGIIRAYTAGIYGVQGPLTFGDSGAATDSYFEDSGVVVAFEDRDIDNDKYYLNVEGNSGATNYFVLRNSTIVTAGPYVSMNFAGGNINTLTLEGITFSALGNGITFSTLADASGHSVTGCLFDGCGIVYPGDVTMDGCTFRNAVDSNGAIEWDLNVTEENQDNMSFYSDGTGHAIYIDIDTASPTTFNIDGYLFDGYAGQSGTAGNRVFYISNPSDGDITINLTNSSATNIQGGGDGFSYELATGTTSTVSVNQTVTLTVTVVDEDGDPIEGARVRIQKASDGSEVTQGTTNSSGVYSDGTYNYTGDLAVVTKARLKGYRNFRTAGMIGSGGISVGVTLQTDQIVDMP